MAHFTPDAGATEPSVEILLVQHDQQQIDLTLELVQGQHLANRIHVLRDGAEALEFLFRSGAYATRQPASPRLVLYHLRLEEITDIDVLKLIRTDPRTSGIPITVLASSTGDRLAAMSALHEWGLQLPVVVVARPTPEETVRALSSIGGGCGKIGEPPSQPDAERAAPTVPVTFDSLCLERDLETLIGIARSTALEFNNLFSVFVAYTELLLKDVDLDDPRRAGAEDFFKSIARASRLTRQLLTFRPTALRTPAPGPLPRRAKRPARGGIARV